MSAVHGPESFTRLEEFPSFKSSIKSFGRPIHPPLLTPSRRHELREFRVAAMNKEAEILKRKNEILKQRQAKISFENHGNYDRLCVHSGMQESCALWYPSSKDSREGISVAISKLPTFGIYSSIHTSATVCSNVIGKSHDHSPRIDRESLSGSEENAVDCIECSKSNINPECSLCQAEHKHSLFKSFATEESPEVPCRTFSLVQQNFSIVDTELNSTEEETEGVSLPTVICNEKYIPLDTDSESNVTFMSQSTDLEKYMGHSCEFNSPDNSAIIWDSKSISQQGTLSKSDDASSETMVNTENELTPCASTMAEFTENIEDELSNADDAADISDTKSLAGRTLKRAHSIDSYMKILQSSTKNVNVKKSLSEPFNTNQEVTSNTIDNTKTAVSSKPAQLIKEDSKESEESKDLLEENAFFQDDKTSAKVIKTADLVSDNNNSSEKKHVRQNSYTLDHPSSALISAHADCTCNLDVNCISPHCSALKDQNMCNPTFTKEIVEITNASSQHQMEKSPIRLFSLSKKAVDSVNLNREDITNAVSDDFPVVKEDSCEKSCSENLKISESAPDFDSTLETEDQLKSADDNLSDRFSESLILSVDAKHEANLQMIYHKICENYEKKCKELEEMQQQQWLKLKEEFKEQEKLLYDNIKLVLPSIGSLPEEKDQITSEENYGNEKTAEVKSVSDKKISVSPILSCQISSDNSTLQNSTLAVLNESPQPACSSKTSVLQNSRASDIHTSIYPSTDYKSNTGLSASSENVELNQISKDDMVLMSNNSYESTEDCTLSNRESLPRVSDFSSIDNLQPHFVSLPQSPKAIAVPINQCCSQMLTCFCGSPIQQCKCCTSVNGYPQCFQILPPGYVSPALEQNSVLYTKDFVNHCDCSQNSSAPSGFQNEGFDHLNSFNISNETNPSSFQNSRKSSLSTQNVTSAHTKTRELHKNPAYTLVKNGEIHQNALLTSVGNGDMFHNKESKDSKFHSLKEKSQLLQVNSSGSLFTKTLMNGNHISENGALNKKINTDPSVMKRFEKLPAFVKGYLTRRLFKTEHVQGLLKTLTDSYILIDELGKELDAKGKQISQRDVDFHRQLYVQLLTTYHKFYDVFFTISTSERMAFIAESRNHRLNQKHANKNQESSNLVCTSASEPTLTRKLSSASLKSLERKNKKKSSIDSRTYTVADYKNLRSRSAIDMRTYIIDNLPTSRERAHSSMSSKSSTSLFPSSVYALKGVAVPLKRKTASVKSSCSQQSHHPKWVP